MLQYELRILREWQCPKCSRTVRTRGAVASRTCACDQPATFMSLVNESPAPNFDVSPFVTYNNEIDATPTERELVEELPAHLMPPPIDTENIKPTFRRGTGYLRAETSPDEEVKAEAGNEDPFGAGIDSVDTAPKAPTSPVTGQTDSKAEARPADPPQVSAGSDEEESDRPGRKRRRRRRRRTRDTPLASAASEATHSKEGETLPSQSALPTPAVDVSESAALPAAKADDASESDPSSSSDETTEDGAPKRKRRRRRRGKK